MILLERIVFLKLFFHKLEESTQTLTNFDIEKNTVIIPIHFQFTAKKYRGLIAKSLTKDSTAKIAVKK